MTDPTAADSNKIFKKRDVRLFMWDFCRWICCQKQHGLSSSFHWHDILTNSLLQGFMASSDLVAESYMKSNNVYRPFLKRILDALEENRFLYGDRTGEKDKREGEEIVEYKVLNRLKENCVKFRHFQSSLEIENIEDILMEDNPTHDHNSDCDDVVRRGG